MPQELPLACSLSATELPGRLREMAVLGADALVDAGTEQRGTRAWLRFAAADGIRRRVEAIVAAESQCCPFLTMRVGDEPGAVVLTIAAPEGAEPLLAELVGAFAGAP
jgi:hypothetical protein